MSSLNFAAMESRPAVITDINGCVLIATYNNERTLGTVLSQVLEIVPASRVLVVNDGSTDSTATILNGFGDRIHVITNPVNKGKGYSLRRGFRKAIELGFDNAITLDSDGQHYPADIPLLAEAARTHPGAVIMGSRDMNQSGVPGKSSFGNKFSNFWFKVETWISLPDTQTGFRIYPLGRLKSMRLFTNRFELEIEAIVRLAWQGTPMIPVPVRVKYDPEERVSHFRPGMDFFRISVLNTVLVTLALLYYYPKKLFSLNTLKVIRHETLNPEESNFKKSLSLAFGVFMGVFPVWGFQLLIGIPLAVLFRMNKVLFIAAAHISVPPMIPIIVYASFLIEATLNGGTVRLEQFTDLSPDALQQNVSQYVTGAVLLSVICFGIVFGVSYLLFTLFRRNGSGSNVPDTLPQP